MMIDEAIEFCKEKSKNIKLKTEPQTFVIIADMLEELKAIENGFTDDLLNMGYTKGYRKAIDDCKEVCNQNWLNGTVANRIVKELTIQMEQLKDGVDNV